MHIFWASFFYYCLQWFFFILKVDILWPWPSYTNFSHRFDIIFNSYYYYLSEYIKGFINIFWKHYKFLFQNMTKLLFFHFFENVPFVTLTLTFIFIIIICLGVGVNKIYFFYITTLMFFLPSSATLHRKKFKLVKNPSFLHFEIRQFMTLTFIHQFLQPVWCNLR